MQRYALNDEYKRLILNKYHVIKFDTKNNLE